MSDVAESPAFGRCPTCGRLVTVPVSARTREVACPVCQHRARGAAFTVEAPLPVVLVDQRDQGAALAARRNGFEPASSDRSGAAPADEARTHLLLDVPMDEEEAPARDPEPAARGRSVRAVDPAGDARTHLLLRPSDLQDDDEPAPEQAKVRSKAKRSRATPGLVRAPLPANEDARTRLLVGPLSLPTEQSERGAAMLGGLLAAALRASVWLDEALHGREVWVRVALAVMAGFVAPSLDYAWTGGRSTFGAVTWASVLFGFGALALARLNGLRSDEGSWDPTLAVARIRTWARLLLESGEELGQAPLHVRLVTLARALALAGMSALIWAGLLGGLRLVFGVPSMVTALPFVGGLLVLVAASVELYAARVAPRLRFSLEEAGHSVAAAAELPPIIDLAEPLPDRCRRSSTKLHETIVALSAWRPRYWPDEVSYRAALARHLERCLPGSRIETERWVGRSRRDGVIDLVVDGVVVVGVKSGFHQASAERAAQQMTSYARVWSGKPMLLAVFDAPLEAIMESPHADELAKLHDELALVTLRMQA